MLIVNINGLKASEITIEWLKKSKDNYIQISTSAFEGCYRFNLWTVTKKGLHRMKKCYRIIPV